MGDFEKHVTVDYLKKAAESLKDINSLSYSLMDLRKDSKVLDVGCGPGLDAIAIAKTIDTGGKVIGLDNSETMLVNACEYAKVEHVEDRVEFVCGSALNLPFASGSFDAVRAERLFQVLPQDSFPPANVFAEMARVLKPKGMLVLIDMDWGSASVDFPDLKLERRFIEIFAQKCRPNGYSGRCFKRWMIESGFAGVTTHVFARVMENLDDCPLGAWAAEDAVKQNMATKIEAAIWMDALREKQARGTFYACANMIVVAGRKACDTIA